MVNLKRFDNYQKTNELAGTLMIAGLILGLGGASAIVNYCSSAFTKWMKEMKFKPTGKKVIIVSTDRNGKPAELEFDELSDKSTGEKFYGVVVNSGDTAQPGYENDQYFLYDKANFDKLKKEMEAGGKFSTGGAKHSWSKTPMTGDPEEDF